MESEEPEKTKRRIVVAVRRKVLDANFLNALKPFTPIYIPIVRTGLLGLGVTTGVILKAAQRSPELA